VERAGLIFFVDVRPKSGYTADGHANRLKSGKQRHTMDPDNPVVKLCAEGMQAEFAGRLDESGSLFIQAWQAAQDDFEACIAAHYLARRQVDFADNLHWNQVALARADAVADERVGQFYPSLYLNLGHSYEINGDPTEARRYYALAAARVAELPPGPYSDVVRRGVTTALQRMSAAPADAGSTLDAL
jgi:hypothetical protein